MLRLLKKLFSRRIVKFAPVGFIVAVLCTTFAMPVFADNNGCNQWPGGRIGYRLDTHYGQVAANAPEDIPLFLDEACTQPNGNHKLFPGDWAVVYFPANQDGNYAVTYPITAPQDGGDDQGLEYTTHYIRGSDLQYIISATGSFTGTDWNEDTWWNHLPTNIGYKSAFPGNGDTVYVGNSVDGGVAGGFNVLSDGYGYYELATGDYSTRVMYSYIPGEAGSGWCYYDSNHTDATDADHAWTMLSQDWSTAGLRQGSNTVSFAGMDASGNYATGQRHIKWDTLAPGMATNLAAIQNSSGHTGWLNLADFNSDENVEIDSNEDTSATTDVSGLNPSSLVTTFDGRTIWGTNGNYQGFDTFSANSGTKNYSLRSVMQAMGVQDDGTGGQGSHSFSFCSYDRAWNLGGCGNSVQIDTIAPTVTYSPNSTSSAWKNSQSVTISASDPGSSDGTGSGLASASYQVSTDGGNTWGDSVSFDKTATVDLPEGTDVIKTTATDVAGNTSTTTSGEYLIDDAAPVVTYTPNSSPWTNNLTVTINVTDAGGSGVQAAYWHMSTDGGKTWTGQNEFTTSTTVDLPQGTIMLRTDAYDNAGNSATYDSGVYLIDKTPPIVTYSPNSSGWTKGLSPSISVTDAGGSGLKSAQYRISTDNGDTWSGFTTFGSNTSVSLPEGRDVLQTVAADNAGNVTTTNSGTYLIDKTPPTCTAHPVDGQFNNTTDGVAVALTYSDNLSGVNASTEQYQWVPAGSSPQDGAWKTYTGQPVTQTTKGQWTLYWCASDNAGNSGSGSFGPYYIGSLTGQIVNPGSSYTFGEDVVTSVQVHSDNSGDITPANGASVTFVVKNQDGGIITNQTKALVVPNNQTQLVWFRYTMSGDNTVGDITMTATINSALADAQHNPFSLGNQCGVGLDTTEDDMGDALTMPKEFDKTRLPAPDSNPSSGSWQEWSYNGGFTQHTYTVSASTAFKIAADLNDPTAYTDENGNVTIKSGYGILEKPTTQISYDYYDDNAITKAQMVLGLYPEWNYDATGGRVFTQTGIHSVLGNISQTFDLPDNNIFSEPGKLTDAVLSRVKDKDMHFTPLAYPDGPYTAEVQAGDIWTPAGKLQAQATDSMTIQGACTNDWQVTATNPHMLQNK